MSSSELTTAQLLREAAKVISSLQTLYEKTESSSSKEIAMLNSVVECEQAAFQYMDRAFYSSTSAAEDTSLSHKDRLTARRKAFRYAVRGKVMHAVHEEPFPCLDVPIQSGAEYPTPPQTDVEHEKDADAAGKDTTEAETKASHLEQEKFAAGREVAEMIVRIEASHKVTDGMMGIVYPKEKTAASLRVTKLVDEFKILLRVCANSLDDTEKQAGAATEDLQGK